MIRVFNLSVDIDVVISTSGTMAHAYVSDDVWPHSDDESLFIRYRLPCYR